MDERLSRVLSDRERRILAQIERRLIESDPDLATQLSGTGGRGADRPVLLGSGLALVVLGSLLGALPVAFAGMALAMFALLGGVARQRPRTA